MRDERREKEEDNAEALRAQRFRREEGRGWKSMSTTRFTTTLDNLSRYYLYSNTSNDARMGRKLIRGMEMGGNLVRENGVCAGPGKDR
jgi:hypothetical protein